MKKVDKLKPQDITDYLLIAYFGDVDDPIYTAVNSAYLDLNRTIEYKKTQDITEEKKALLRQTSVKMIKDQIIKLSKHGFFDKEMFDSWHSELCEAICQKYNDSGIHFHFGQAQKWVNMTMKYLSVIDSTMTEGYFECLHVPIDSIVFDLALEEFGLERPANRWSRMTKEEYISYQGALCSRIKENTGLSPLLWEFRSWNR